MKNRAKCKLCKSVIESFHSTDLVYCECGEIGVDGGPDGMRVIARDWENFIRVDDLGNEIAIKVIDDKKEDQLPEVAMPKPTKEELLNILDEMVKNIENLPPQAMHTPINHYDYCSLMILLSSIFRSDLRSD